MSQKGDQFFRALRALCEEHGVQIGVECDGRVFLNDWQVGSDDPVLFQDIDDVTTDAPRSDKPAGVKGVRIPEGTEVSIQWGDRCYVLGRGEAQQ